MLPFIDYSSPIAIMKMHFNAFHFNNKSITETPENFLSNSKFRNTRSFNNNQPTNP